MITLHTWNAPSGRIVSIALEELGLPYRVAPVDIKAGEQKAEAFLALNPNGKIPAIEDGAAGIRMAESGPILLHLAERCGRLLPTAPQERVTVLQWVSWATTGLGPMVVQLHHFRHFNKGASDYSESRYSVEAERLYTILDARLAGRDYIADALSIADFAAWPWVARFDWQGIDLAHYPNVRAWYLRMADRPSVRRGYHVPAKVEDIPVPEQDSSCDTPGSDEQD